MGRLVENFKLTINELLFFPKVFQERDEQLRLMYTFEFLLQRFSEINNPSFQLLKMISEVVYNETEKSTIQSEQLSGILNGIVLQSLTYRYLLLLRKVSLIELDKPQSEHRMRALFIEYITEGLQNEQTIIHATQKYYMDKISKKSDLLGESGRQFLNNNFAFFMTQSRLAADYIYNETQKNGSNPVWFPPINIDTRTDLFRCVQGMIKNWIDPESSKLRLAAKNMWNHAD